MMDLVNAGGRPAKTLEQDQIAEIETLAGVLNKEQLADYFGITAKTFRAIEQRQPEVFTAYRKGKAKAIERAASALMKGVERGDMRAIQFFLKTQAGWTEKHALEVSAMHQNEDWDGKIEIVRVEPGPDGKPVLSDESRTIEIDSGD